MGRSGRPSTLGAGKFSCTADFSKIAECDAVPLAIQTPFLDKKDLFPDFTRLSRGAGTPGGTSCPGRSSSLGQRSPREWPGRSSKWSRGSSPGRISPSRTPPGDGRPAALEYPGARSGRRWDRRGQHGAGGGALLAGSSR